MADTPEQNEAKRFDKIIKENREAFFRPFVQKVLGIDIVSGTPLFEKLHTTLEREIDFVYKVTDRNNKEFILHLEFQSTEEKDMIYRMAEYWAILQKNHKIPVKQFVIYLGAGVSRMRNELNEEEIIKGFELISLSQVGFAELLKSEIPQEILFAILCDFHLEEPQEIIQAILQRLKDLCPDEATFRKFVTQLNVLSQLRKLDKEVYKQALAMPIEIDITQNYAYKVATEKGLKEGRKKGLKEGAEKNQILTVKRALVSKAFISRTISYSDIAEFSGLSIERVKEIHKGLTTK